MNREHDDFGWALGVLLRAYQSTVVVELGEFPHGPRGYQTLTEVVRGEHPSQLALAAYLGIDRTVMTYLIDDLVAAGLVERRLNPADRRQRKVVATAAGRRALQDLQKRVRTAEDTVLGTLSPAERDAFRALLRRVACAVRDIDEVTDPCDVVASALAGSAATPTRSAAG
ncbi:MarR family winged helix-turn-helix transcriptional regulator [Hamadaea sp.]|uniref:MarR family winged helix-turn-helix transcriptional regulator n=1 Tax=Hamadaea sp. TaxID=2024425 RepID=UPI0025C45E2F|nr:MarR family winged helix-turn-helix transcriptional regulator [Hamadaea sp.]